MKGDVKAEINTLRNDLPQIVTDAVKDVITDEFTKVKDKLSEWKTTILTSNDKVSKEYKTFETEAAAINGNYQKLEKRVRKLEPKDG